MVRTNTTQGPGGDAAIVRIKETDSSIAMSLDGNGRYAHPMIKPGQFIQPGDRAAFPEGHG